LRGAPADVVALFDRALACHREGRLAEAEAVYQSIIAERPTHFDSQHLLGVVYHQRGDHDAAVRQIDTALALNPNSAAAHSNRGSALKELKRFEHALASYDRALAIRPQHPEVLFNRGSVLQQLGRNDEALACFDQALAIKPDYPDALINRGSLLQELERLDDALACYDAALKLNPKYAQAHNNRGTVLAQLDRTTEALTAYDIAVVIKPDYAEAHYNRGQALRDLGRLDAAHASFDRAVAARPDYAEAAFSRATTLRELDRFDEALASYDQAIAIRSEYAEAWFNRGAMLRERNRFEEALASLDRSAVLKPGQKYLSGARLHARMNICDWTDFDDICSQLTTEVRGGQAAATPFTMLAMPSAPLDQRRCAEIYVADKCPASPAPLWCGERYAHDRIRIAYLSADFRDHATTYLMAGLFERHDRTQFETTAISFSPGQASDMGRRLRRSFDRFVDVSAQSDDAVARLLRDLEIDIAVDLKGFTQGARTGILAARPAPVQVNYLGYPGTMGAPYIDYVIADRFVIPPDRREGFSERVVCLPDSYQVNDRDRKISEATPMRSQVGLPRQGFVFCSFNNVYKITPDLFDVWMLLLREIDGSVLWLLDSNATAPRNLRNEAERRGVAADRLIFAPKLDLADHLARHRLADLFLDTLYCNAHTTASDALWAGLPVLTCAGATFASRVAGSLLSAVGLPELITTSLGVYKDLALQLARDPTRLTAIKARLAGNRDTQPLFDTERFTRHIETAYRSMWERQQRGKAPEDFSVAPFPPAGLPR